MIENSLYTYLTSQTSLTALVSTRIYPDRFPQEVTLPAIMYERVSTPYDRTLDAYIIASPRFQFNLQALTSWELVQIADILRQVLDNYKATMGDQRIEGAFLVDERTDYDKDGDTYIREMDFVIWHKPVV